MPTMSGNVGAYMVPIGGVQRRTFAGSGLIDVGELAPKKRKRKKGRTRVRGGSDDQLWTHHAGGQS